MTRTRTAFQPLPLALQISALALALSGQVQAETYQINDDLKVNWDTTVTYSIAWCEEVLDLALGWRWWEEAG